MTETICHKCYKSLATGILKYKGLIWCNDCFALRDEVPGFYIRSSTGKAFWGKALVRLYPISQWHPDWQVFLPGPALKRLRDGGRHCRSDARFDSLQLALDWINSLPRELKRDKRGAIIHASIQNQVAED